MKIFLEKAIFINRAPFDNMELDFTENEISVLSAVNGRGKTTILSHIVDAFHEFARPHFQNEYEGKENKFYRVSSVIHNLDTNKPSFVYLRFKIGDEIVDYLDVRNTCSDKEYNEAITIDNKIPFNQFQQELKDGNYTKTISTNFKKEKAEDIFKNNLLTYFPAYRYEQPGYLNDPYKIKLDFKKLSGYSGHLPNPIEVISGLPQLANWIMDVVLDMQYSQSGVGVLKNNLDLIITHILVSKNYGNVSFGIGQRNLGGTRIQIVNTQDRSQIYPTIFNLSSGESSLICLFGELIRQSDNIKNNILLPDITGIVLIDEIDKHLHIKLQKEILPRLFKLFPNVQFIVSSHSPFLSLGLAQETSNRSKIKSLDTGLDLQPENVEEYEDVYKMMIGENERFKNMYNDIKGQIETKKSLQIITEGKNTEHIEKAISIIEPNLYDKIKIIKGSEDKSGDQQLKNAFEIMSKGDHPNKFLFVRDCDSIDLVNKITEKENFSKFCFPKNDTNNKAKKGVENLYPSDLFTDDVYDEKETEIDYGGTKKEKTFNKGKFLEKIKTETDTNKFKNFMPLVDKIKEITNFIQETST